MANYRIEYTNVAERTADVVEQATGITVCSNVPLEEARKWVRQLNGGRGFNGFTPEFFMGRLKVTLSA